MPESTLTSGDGMDEDHIRRLRSMAAGDDARLEGGETREPGAPPTTPTWADEEAIWRLTATTPTRAPSPETILARAHVRGLRRRTAVLSLAAVALLAVAAGGVWIRRGPSVPIEVIAGARDTTTTLPDGSTLRLAPATTVRYHATRRTRVLALHGHAFIAVAADSGRPFRIDAAGSTVEVLGTRFDLISTVDSTRLTLLEGHVAIENAHGRRTLRAGQVARIIGDASPVVAPMHRPYPLAGWDTQPLIFHATPLARAAREIAAVFGREIVVDSALAHYTVTATFGSESFEEIVTTVCQVVGASCDTQPTARIAP